MVHITEVSAGFVFLSGLASLALVVLSVRAYQRTRDGKFGFLAGAFSVFTGKALLVSYSLYSGLIEHQLLELVDAIGDLATLFLILAPVAWPGRTHETEP